MAIPEATHPTPVQPSSPTDAKLPKIPERAKGDQVDVKKAKTNDVDEPAFNKMLKNCRVVMTREHVSAPCEPKRVNAPLRDGQPGGKQTNEGRDRVQENDQAQC